MPNAVQETRKLGQSIWYDNIRRGVITSGEWKRLVGLGVTGLTSNPTIFEKAIAGSTDYDDALRDLARDGKDVDEMYETLVIDDIRAAVDELRPVYEETEGRDGYGSLEVSPALAHDTKGTVAEARRLFKDLARPNVMIKVPATPAGVPAVRQLIGDGINVNVTLIFSLEAYRQVVEAYIQGLEDLAKRGGDLTKVASVASFFLSRVDTQVDKILEEKVRDGSEEASKYLGTAAIANATTAYAIFKDIFEGERFGELRAKAARAQRPLWASTSTKNPAYNELLYVENLIAPDTVNTLPPATLTTLFERGGAQVSLTGDASDAQANLQAMADIGVDMDAVTDKLLADGVKAFADSFDKLMENIAGKAAALLSSDGAHPLAGLSAARPAVEEAMDRVRSQEIVERIWRKDHTVWKLDPTEITNRLGWLGLSEMMEEQVPILQEFAEEVKADGFKDVVLLGMGGSSLGPEVLRQTFGVQRGCPKLTVLDSTAPAWVRSVAEAIDPAKTLFLVSSKSGATVEPLMFYAYFRQLVEQAIGPDRAGGSFVAVTDRGTPLETMAADHGFRRVFANPADIGGRYSVLSYFGLVPAALAGYEVAELLERANRLREGAAPFVPSDDNTCGWLGAAMGALARQGRDKLTLITSPGISSFGLWVEQLLAESTGKEGTGIVPVAGEPLMPPSVYGQDRFFVYLRLEDDDNTETDAAVDRLRNESHPLVQLELKDRFDIGAEFFRWEMATAVAGHILGIHPFDQPNVQEAKDATNRLLQHYQRERALPRRPQAATASELLRQAGPGSYLAIQAYAPKGPEIEQAVQDLRRRVVEEHHIATTMGYGPRYLHSTGQLHKGGPPTGLFLQIEAGHEPDLPIPGYPYSFGVLARAQAMGDLEALASLGRPVARTDGEADFLS